MVTYMNQTNSGRIIVQQTSPSAIIVQPDNERKIILKGSGGLKGETGDAATITVGSTTTGEPGTSASVVNSGTSSDAVLDFVIPKGSKGDKGDTGATGATGPANTLSIGTVQKGDTAEATITGDAPNQTLNLTLPKGDKGDTGSQGPAGAGVITGGSTGQVLTKKSGTDYDTEWATPATYSAGTGINIANDTISVDTTQVSMKSEHAVKKSYTIDLTAQSTSNFYPVIFPRTNSMIDCEIHSQGGGSAEPYNQNIIHFNVISEGWSDNYVTKKLIILQEGNYSNSEITIGCIGLGHQDGYNCVWLRGGIMYYFTSNYVAEAHTSDYQINNEKFTVGPNYYGGTNANVDIARTPLNTSKDVALLEDVDARANLYRYTKSQYNSSSSSWYYPIANLPIDNSGNSASVIINGRFGGWTNANMAKIDLLLTNRSNYSGDNVTASGSIKGPYTGALATCNVVVYKQTDKSAIVYLKCDGYFAFDITADYYQATKSWTGNYTTTPSGTLIWSTATTDALEKVDQNGRISKVREVYNYYTSRPTTANTTATGNGGMFTFQATGSMDTAKPKSDGHVLQLEWDNTSGYDSQVAVSNNSNNPWLAIRAQNAGAWGNWVYLLNDEAGSVKTANIDALAVTTAKIDDGAVTADKIASGVIPVVNDATLTITQNGSTLGTFSANASSNVTIDIPGGGGGGSYTAGVGIEIASDTIEVDDTVALIDNPTTSETPTPWVETSMIENDAVTPEKATFTEYSTTEQVVGTWIDGKPLYRVVLSGNISSTTGTYVPTNTYNAATVDVVSCTGKLVNDQNQYMQLGCYLNSSNYSGWFMSASAMTIFFPSAYNNGAYTIVIEYTKKTS